MLQMTPSQLKARSCGPQQPAIVTMDPEALNLQLWTMRWHTFFGIRR
jgi:hypothetical protein